MSASPKRPGQLVSSIDIVSQSWGEDVPHWIITLAEECDKTSQAKVAQKIGRSPALVNQVLKKTYKADLNAIQGRVETVFGCQIACPVLGLIDGDRCLSEQDKPYRPYNHVMVSLYRACRKCPRRLPKAGEHNAAE